MAEQSIGMASGSGDGTVGGYTADRMRSMELSTFSEGVLQNNDGTAAFVLGGATTNALTIGAGNAIVNGWFYQNTTSASISVATGVPNATYNLVIVANNSALTPAVTKTASGTATIPVYSVRLALATTAQITTITGAGQAVFTLASSVVITGGLVTSFSMDINNIYSIARNTPYQTGEVLTGGTATLTTASTLYDIVNYTTGASTTDGILTVNLTTGVFTIKREGWYIITFQGRFNAGTTSWRRLILTINATQTWRTDVASSGASNHFAQITGLSYLVAGDTVKAQASSGLAAQTIDAGTFTIALV